MAGFKRKVLITGCSDGGLGAALAIAFHKAGLHVYATSRNPSKMKHIESIGIQILTLDVLSESSIADCVNEISDLGLDILVNNAGASYSMPVSDISIADAQKLFALNVFSYLAVTQAFLPLLIKSKGMIVNQTSVVSVIPMPFGSVYNASKAAIASFTGSMRLELEPFGIRVIDLKTGGVQSHIIDNSPTAVLPEESVYIPAREVVENSMNAKEAMKKVPPADKWAEGVVGNLLQANPPKNIWRGSSAWLVWFLTMQPFGWFIDGILKKMAKVDVVKKILAAREGK